MNVYRLLKPVIRFFTNLHIKLYLKYDGKYLGSINGYPICLLTTIGRKTGLPRVIPLLTIPYEGNYILVASQGGAPVHPIWYLNTLENPNIVLQIGAEKMEMIATELDYEQKANIWPMIVKAYPDYDAYKKRTDRDIPVLICKTVD